MSVLVARAAQFAREAHAGQCRKWTGAEYITHPERVAAAVAKLPEATDVQVAAAWLHDVLEDCSDKCDGPELERLFGIDVAVLVYELTNTSKVLYPTMPRRARKLYDHSRISTCSVWARRIKVLDRIDNLRELELRDSFAPLYLAESGHLYQLLAASKPSDHVLDVLLSDLTNLITDLRQIVDRLNGTFAPNAAANRQAPGR